MEKHLITANQQPHRKNYLTRLVRFFVSLLPALVPNKFRVRRPMGVSVYMRVKDERDWIIPSINSIRPIADEICIADNGSSDGTYELLSELAAKEKDFIRLWRCPELKHVELSNFILRKTRYHYVLRWDGDMVAHTSGEFDIRKLRNRLLELNPRIFYVIYLRHINLSGDLSHQDRREMVHIEEYIHTYSKNAYFIHPGRFEAVKFPLYYRPLFWYEPYAFHVNVKPRLRMLKRFFWEEWMEKKEYNTYPNLEDYMKSRIQEIFGTDDETEAARRCLKETLIYHIPYDEKKFGPYPALLIPHLNSPIYSLEYRDGRPEDRREPYEG
ncbi:MAG: glycosyltransferase family 2 protein [Syntrophales bacterium]|nr:glycosyltransferase family 2 protein [Syntrophales bacterium]